jgi:hypothetical protein
MSVNFSINLLQERANVPISRVLGPLQYNAFIAAGRDSIPSVAVRVTTASTRGNFRGRGRGRSCATREPAKRKEPQAQTGSSRGRKKISAKEASTSAQSGYAQTAQGQAQAVQDHAAGAMNQAQGCLNQAQAKALGYNNTKVVPDKNVQEFALSQIAPNDDDI